MILANPKHVYKYYQSVVVDTTSVAITITKIKDEIFNLLKMLSLLHSRFESYTRSHVQIQS